MKEKTIRADTLEMILKIANTNRNNSVLGVHLEVRGNEVHHVQNVIIGGGWVGNNCETCGEKILLGQICTSISLKVYHLSCYPHPYKIKYNRSNEDYDLMFDEFVGLTVLPAK